MCGFVDLEKALWEMLWEYGVPGLLLQAIQSLYEHNKMQVCIQHSDLVLDFHGQNLEVQPRPGVCLTLELEDYVLALCR